MAERLGDGDVMPTERPFEALAEHEAADTRVDTIGTYQEIAALGAAIAEAHLDSVRGRADLHDLATEADIGALAHEIVKRGLEIAAAEKDIAAERPGDGRGALAAQETPVRSVE